MSVRATPESLAGFHVEGSRTAAGTAAGVHFDHVRTAAGDLLHTLKGGSVADDHAPHPYLGSLVVVALLLALLLLLARFFGLIGSSKSSSGARPFLPAFDVEGGSSSTSDSRILPPSIAKAASTSDVAMLRAWVSDERCVIDAALSTDGTTALHHGARAGHANVVRLLLDHGADCLAVDTELRTPLHYVAAAGHGLCVKALLDRGADPECKDGTGVTPLSLAEAGGHTGTARMMRLYLGRRNAEGAGLRRNI